MALTNRNNKQGAGGKERSWRTLRSQLGQQWTVEVGLRRQEHREKETKTPGGPNNLIIPAPQSKQKWQPQSVHCQWRLSFVKPIQEVGSQATRTMPSDKQEDSLFYPCLPPGSPSEVLIFWWRSEGEGSAWPGHCPQGLGPLNGALSAHQLPLSTLHLWTLAPMSPWPC